ncbi:MAG TPA: PP2C family protein-serine/threonine phosphatase [Acidimicrobiia bacterium]|nr:PP2C family protein-serine/threonine phosphatase [Acidimicrobiia bacterium]
MGREVSPEPAADLLADAHFAVPDEVPGLLAKHARRLGALDATIFLCDFDQRLLVPLPRPGGPHREAVGVEGTLAGRAFATLSFQWNADRTLLWVPMVEGNERLGVVGFELTGDEDDEDDDFVGAAARLTAQAAELVATKAAYGDFFELYRRIEPMSIASELAWQLLPPLTFGGDRVVISGALVPAYDLGGDTFDYGVDQETARIAVFDAMGHALEAGLLATVAVAAYRNSRRRRLKLADTVATIDETIRARFGPERFVTAVLGELDLGSGVFRWIRAGHPAPLLLRGSKIVKTLWGDHGLPLGLGSPGQEAEESLEPGDQLVFFTDGVTEARSSDGTFFGTERLADLVSRASAGGNPPPETLRRLVHSILDHQAGDLQDDATAVLVEWKGQGRSTLEI